MRQVIRGAVRGRTLDVVPDELVWIELGSVARKEMRLKARVSSQEIACRGALVGRTAVPEQNDRTTQVLEQLPEESRHMRRLDVLAAVEPGVEGSSPSLWRYADGRDSRNLAPAAMATQERRLALRRPCPNHVWDREKAAFVEKGQVGSKSFGFFLYAAKRSVSSARWPSRPALSPASRASGNSIPNGEESSRHSAANSERRSVLRFLCAPGRGSRDPLSSPLSAAFSTGTSPIAASAWRTVARACRKPAEVSGRACPPSEKPAASGPRNSAKIPVLSRPRDAAARSEVVRLRGADVSLVATARRVVSCPG